MSESTRRERINALVLNQMNYSIFWEDLDSNSCQYFCLHVFAPINNPLRREKTTFTIINT
jgi:hypothetical protein